MGPSKKPKRGRPPNPDRPTRRRLIEAAADLFNQDGYFATDTNKIARAAGFAPATFYKHFGGKKEIFLEAYAEWVAGDWEVIESAVRPGRPPREVARDIVRKHLARHSKWISFRRSMHGLVAIDTEVRDFHLRTRAAQLDRMAELLERVGAPVLSKTQLLYSFLCVERSLNAVSDGELDIPGVNRRGFVSQIEEEIVFQLSGELDR